MTFSIVPIDSSEAMQTLVITRSTELLEQTAFVCQHALSLPTPPLDKDRHIAFLTHLGLQAQLPRAFVALDASRPWMMYWTLCALKVLGEDITPHRER
jgi:protein farnesyltransferase subunit beta